MKQFFSRFKYKIVIIASIFLLPNPSMHLSHAAVKSPDGVFTLVIDAGHGGKDFGAIDNNQREKDINLGVAKKLAAKIKKELPDVNVVLTRDNDSFISLQERAAIANENKGNLFISIHTNSVDKTNPKRMSVAGASVYALGLHKDKDNLQVAMRENSVIELEKNFDQKYSGFDPSKDESYIIFEMAQKKNLAQSLKFADLAQKNLVSVAGRGDRGVKQAGFWVLWATSMPAVLVELDFICNPNIAVYIGSETGQEQMSEALFKAFEKYYTSIKNQKSVTKESKSDSNKNVDNDSNTPVMTSSRPVEKQIIEAAGKSRPAVTAKRRRRSDSSKKLSDERNVEIAAIPLHSEEERLPIMKAEKEQQILVSESPVQKESKNKKEKKKKNTGLKKEKAYASAVQNKKIIVAEDGSSTMVDAESNTEKGQKYHKSISGYHSKVQKLKTIYKIQILTSEEILKQNNPLFQGLSPIKSFRENNLYKYTYGESENRSEMETLLEKIKELIPDAFIIKNLRPI